MQVSRLKECENANNSDVMSVRSGNWIDMACTAWKRMEGRIYEWT